MAIKAYHQVAAVCLNKCCQVILRGEHSLIQGMGGTSIMRTATYYRGQNKKLAVT